MTNKKPRQTKRSRIFLLLSVIVIILLVGAGLAYWKHHKKPAPVAAAPVANNTINYSPSKPSDNAANDARKGSAPANSTLDGSSGSGVSTPLSVTITRAGVVGNQLQVGTLVEGAASGTCTLSVAQTGQQTVTKTEAIQLQNNTYTCPVFDLPTSQFPDQGNWNVSVAVTSNGSTASGQWQANPVSLGS